MFEKHSFQWRKQEVPQIKRFCLFPAEEDLHSGTARKPVLSTQRTAFPEEHIHVPSQLVESVQGREKRAYHKLTIELHLRRMHTSRGKKGTGGMRGESSGRGEGKPKPKHRAKKVVECTKHKPEGKKEKTEIGEK